MGRRVWVDKSHTQSGSLGREAHKDGPTYPVAGQGSFGRNYNSLRTEVLLHKPGSPTSERGLATGVTRSSSPFSLSSTPKNSSDFTSAASSRDIRSPSRSSQIDRFDSTAKSLLSSTGRALRKHASKLSLASSITYDKNEEGRVVWKLSGLGAAEQDPVPAPSSARRDLLKRAISAPFNFKHVTHTYREQVRGLERASRNELISEFSAIRAGQRADSKLRGIKAQSLVSQANPAPHAKAESDSESLETDPTGAPSVAPTAAQSDPQLSPKGSNVTSNVRGSRGVENFSRPVSRTSLSPIPPPKRVSSLNACVPFLSAVRDAPSVHEGVPGAGMYPRRPSRPTISPVSSPVVSNRPGQDTEVIVVGHAISTADDSARHLKASPLPMPPADLEDVPEDDEGFVQSENRMTEVTRDARSLPLRHVQSFPSSRQNVDTGLATATPVNVQRHTMSLDEAHAHLSQEERPNHWLDFPNHQTGRDTNRFPVGLKPMCQTQQWEDDVDYCYEHAAEAASDFDWDQQVASFPVGLQPAVFDPSVPVGQSLTQLQPLAGHRKHDSQESSVLSITSSIADIATSTNSIGSLPELDYSINSSRESMDWEACQKNKRYGKAARRSQTTQSPKSVKPRQGLGLSYSLFPYPPRTP